MNLSFLNRFFSRSDRHGDAASGKGSSGRMKLMSGLAILAAVSVAAGGAYAYFNGHTRLKVNNFSIVGGERDVVMGEILEPNWDPATASNLAPTQSVPKDPRLKSGVDYSSYAFMKVIVPKAYGSTDLEEDYSYQDALRFEINDGWVPIADSNANANETSGHIYLYMYGSSRSNPTVLEAGGTTTPLFNEITVPDFVRVQAQSGSIDVEGFTEQYVGVDLDTAIADAIDWAAIRQ